MSRHTIEELHGAVRKLSEGRSTAEDETALEAAIAELEQRRGEDATFTGLIEHYRFQERNAGHLRRALKDIAFGWEHEAPSASGAAFGALSAEKQRKARRRKAARR